MKSTRNRQLRDLDKRESQTLEDSEKVKNITIIENSSSMRNYFDVIIGKIRPIMVHFNMLILY